MNQLENQVTLADRRGAIRHACVINATANEQMMHIGPGWLAKVIDISTTGVGLRLGEGFPTDSVLTLDLHGQNQSLEAVSVRVVRCLEEPAGTWFLGGAFVSPLEEEQLERLLS